jgi:hypothetical protein
LEPNIGGSWFWNFLFCGLAFRISNFLWYSDPNLCNFFVSANPGEESKRRFCAVFCRVPVLA